MDEGVTAGEWASAAVRAREAVEEFMYDLRLNGTIVELDCNASDPFVVAERSYLRGWQDAVITMALGGAGND